MPRRRQPRTVLDHCVAKRGIHRGALTAAHVAQWALARNELGHFPTTVEYAECWFVDERSGWRHRAGIREVFGEDWADVVEQVAAEIERRSIRSPRAAAAVAVPAAVGA